MQDMASSAEAGHEYREGTNLLEKIKTQVYSGIDAWIAQIIMLCLYSIISQQLGKSINVSSDSNSIHSNIACLLNTTMKAELEWSWLSHLKPEFIDTWTPRNKGNPNSGSTWEWKAWCRNVSPPRWKTPWRSSSLTHTACSGLACKRWFSVLSL